jgi:hypothetical protein
MYLCVCVCVCVFEYTHTHTHTHTHRVFTSRADMLTTTGSWSKDTCDTASCLM